MSRVGAMPPLTGTVPAPLAPLYAKLRPGPNGPGREQVARHQRARLYGAMVEMVVARGYAGTSIKGVCALAGVSRRTFYDLFGDADAPPKEACFLAAYDCVVGGAVHRIRTAYRGGRDPRGRLQQAFEHFAREIVGRPTFARFALVEALGAGPSALGRMDRGRRAFEKMVSTSFSEGPDGVLLPPLVAKGIVCGVERVSRQRLLAGNVHQLPGLASELLGWALCYRSRDATDLLAASSADQELPVRAESPVRLESERVRILSSAAHIAAVKGYAQLTPAQIAHAAGVPEERFHQFFTSTEQCFLDALDRMALEALVGAAKVWRSRGEDRSIGLHGGMLALMRHLAHDRRLARLAFVEIFAVGPAGIERRERLLGQFTKLLTGSLPRSGRPSALVTDATAGAIWGIVHAYVTQGAARRLPEVAGYATYMALAPVIGADAAVETVRRAGDSLDPSATVPAGL